MYLVASRVGGNLQINPPFSYFLLVSLFVLDDCAGLRNSVLLCPSVTLMCLFVIVQWTRSGSLWVPFVVSKVIFSLDQFPDLAYCTAQSRFGGRNSAGWCCPWL